MNLIVITLKILTLFFSIIIIIIIIEIQLQIHWTNDLELYLMLWAKGIPIEDRTLMLKLTLTLMQCSNENHKKYFNNSLNTNVNTYKLSGHKKHVNWTIFDVFVLIIILGPFGPLRCKILARALIFHGWMQDQWKS